MSFELLYTSASQGLKPGAVGFCTVVATEGISRLLQDRLESLSGYEHPFSLTDARAPLNPVNVSLLQVTAGNQKFSVLSRVADAGADYSGRSNKLAHHVAFAPDELAGRSPSGALVAPGFFRTTYEGTPHSAPVAVRPFVNRPPTVCHAWQTLTGDAGWAGALVQMALQQPPRPVTLIFQPGVDVLPLVAEALSLLPPQQQWRTTFSTFFTRLPAGVDCQWRFVLEGTPAAEAARRNLQTPPIVLASAGPVPREGPYVLAARSGQPPVVDDASSSVSGLSAGTVVVPSRSSAVATPSLPSPTGPLPPVLRPARADDLFRKLSELSLSLVAMLASAAGMLVLLVVLAVAYISPGAAPPPIANASLRHAPNEIEESPPSFLNHRQPDQPSVAAAQPDVNLASTATPTNPAPTLVVIEDKLPPAFQDLKDARGHAKVLELPKRDTSLTASDAGSSKPLGKLFVRSIADVRLDLVTKDQDSGDGNSSKGKTTLFINPGIFSDSVSRTWIVSYRGDANSFGEAPTEPIGKFTLQKNALHYDLEFAWKDNAPEWSHPDELMYSQLQVAVGDEKLQCNLSAPVILAEAALNFSERRQYIDLGVPNLSQALASELRADIELLLDGGNKQINALEYGKTGEVMIPLNTKNGDDKIGVKFDLRPPERNQSLRLGYSLHLYLPVLSPEGAIDASGMDKHWIPREVRTDKFDSNLMNSKFEALRNDLQVGLTLSDFDRLGEWIRGSRSAAQGKGEKLEKKLKEWRAMQAKLGGEKRSTLGPSDLADLDKANKEIPKLEKEKDFWDQAVKKSEDLDRRLAGLKSEVESFATNVKVRFSAYRPGLGEPQVFARTEILPAPAPKKTKGDRRPPEPNPPRIENSQSTSTKRRAQGATKAFFPTLPAENSVKPTGGF